MSIIFSILMLLSACRPGEPDWQQTKAQIRKEFPRVQQITIDEFRREYAGKAFVVDVRKPEEYKVSHLQNAINLADVDEIISRARVSGKNAVVLYCSVGYRSSKLAQKLKTETHLQVYNLEGSIFEWVNSGLPVYNGEKKVEKVHPYNAYWGKLLDKKFRE